MIRILIERKVVASMEVPFHNALIKARETAQNYPGYIGGETLRDIENPHHHIILCTWKSKSDWEKWLLSEDKSALDAAISPCLQEPESHLLMEIV